MIITLFYTLYDMHTMHVIYRTTFLRITDNVLAMATDVSLNQSIDMFIAGRIIIVWIKCP